MPIYEYEKCDGDCEICPGRFDALQGINDDPLAYCPTCGLSVKRVVSPMRFAIDKTTNYDKAAKQGFSTYKKSEYGVWEKVAGEGVDAIVSSEEDKRAVAEEKSATKKSKSFDL